MELEPYAFTRRKPLVRKKVFDDGRPITLTFVRHNDVWTVVLEHPYLTLATNDKDPGEARKTLTRQLRWHYNNNWVYALGVTRDV